VLLRHLILRHTSQLFSLDVSFLMSSLLAEYFVLDAMVIVLPTS